jgi:hypothetical protein
MSKIVIHAWGEKGLSVNHIADDLKKRLSGDVEVTNKLDDIAGATIINLIPHDTLKIAKVKRYCSFEKIIHVFVSNLYELTESELVGIIHEQAVNGKIVCFSRTSYNDIMDFVKSHYAPQKVLQMMDNILHISYGIDFDVFKLSKENDKNKFIVPHTRINNIQKNADLHHEITKEFNHYCKSKHNVEPEHHLLYHPIYEEKAKSLSNTYVVREQFYDREGYVNLAKSCGMFLSTSVTESFGLMFLELLAMGVVGVFLDKKWIRRLLPNYPFIAQQKDLLSMMVTVYENYEDSRKILLDEVIPEIKEKYNIDTFCKEVEKLI